MFAFGWKSQYSEQEPGGNVAKFTAEMKKTIENTRVFAVATANRDGEPNVAAISFVKVLSDDEFLVMDNFMLKTRQNIEANPRMAIAAWADHSGYQFKGTASIETTGKVFEEGVAWVKSIAPPLAPKAAIILKVDEIYIGTGGPDAGKKIA